MAGTNFDACAHDQLSPPWRSIHRAVSWRPDAPTACSPYGRWTTPKPNFGVTASNEGIFTLAFHPEGQMIAAGGYGEHRDACVGCAEWRTARQPRSHGMAGREAIEARLERDLFSGGRHSAGGRRRWAFFACKPAPSGSWTCPLAYQDKGKESIFSLVYSPDGRQVAWSSGGEVTVWDASSPNQRALSTKMRAHRFAAWPSSRLAASGGLRSARRAECDTVMSRKMPVRHERANMETFDAPAACRALRSRSVTDWISSVAFDPGSGLLAAASRNGYVASSILAGTTPRER